MHYPTVGERVWVRGCSHELIVVRADYSSCVATLSPAEVRGQLRRCPFILLFARDDFAASQSELSPTEVNAGLLQSTRGCIRGSWAAIQQMRDVANLTADLIVRSQEMIEQTDKTLARWKLLGCKP